MPSPPTETQAFPSGKETQQWVFSKKCTCQLIRGTCFLQVLQDTEEPVQKSPEEQAQGDHQDGSEAPEMSWNTVVQ